jgi:membrane associated rhomboid family serine protease
MGLYDRDYVRDEPSGSFLGANNRTMVTNLILINVAVFVADVLFRGQISDLLSLKADLLDRPWYCWQLLTYGFVHDPHNILHVGFNMFGLWLFGRDVEIIYGRRELLRLYLTLIVLCGIVWLIVQTALAGAAHGARSASLMGASGAVVGVMVLYVTHYPRRLFYFWGILPIPAWVLCTLYIAQDVLGFSHSMQGGGGDTAYEAHLAGAVFAFLYRRSGWNLGRLVPERFSAAMLNRPRLRIHDPRPEAGPSLEHRVDEILAKISSEGEASLTREERKILEDASRRYQKRRQ